MYLNKYIMAQLAKQKADKQTSEQHFRIFDFSAYDISMREEDDDSDEDECEYKPKGKKIDENEFKIQMFGINEKGESCAIKVTDYNPFFFIKVNESWEKKHLTQFKEHIVGLIGKYYEKSIVSLELVDRKKLYGFDGGITHKFVRITFKNTICMNKVKNLWYEIKKQPKYTKTLLKLGFKYPNGPGEKYLEIYEGNIPPLLRYFHISQISPSGWINIKNAKPRGRFAKETHCKYEFEISEKCIEALNDKEERVPYKICSFDIEASSSHGDFPVPIKTYKKLATNIVEHFEDIGIDKFNKNTIRPILTNIILTAFGYENTSGIDLVYPKRHPNSKEFIIELCNRWLECKVRSIKKSDDFNQANSIEKMFETKQLVIAVIDVISMVLPFSTLLGNVINKLATVPVGEQLAMNLLKFTFANRF